VIDTYQMYVDGAWSGAAGGEYLDSVDPYRNEVWARFPRGDRADVDRAVTAAARAFEQTPWPARIKERARLLHRLAGLVTAGAEHLAQVESRDHGKTIREERGATASAAAWYRFAAATAETASGDIPGGNDPDVLALTVREPYGVIGIQTPWNTPSVLLAQVLSMALAAGNTVVVKPSELAPCSTLEFGRLVEQAGFPPGVFNVVTGTGDVVGEALCQHPLVAKLALTGGPDAGRRVAHHAAERLVPAMMELGGKSANLVFADADIGSTAEALVTAFTGAAGQSCVAGSRVLAHRSVHDELVERMAVHAAKIRVGNPQDPGTDMGPMCTRQQVERVERFVAAGEAEGARLVAGGRVPADPRGGLFFPPTIFAGVTPDMTIAQQEIFGPVVCVIPFETEAEAIAVNNGTAYGLAAGIWTSDLDRAHRVARQLRAGTVWINHYRRGDAAFPFGGYGQSGYGRVNGIDGYREMSRVKSIQLLLRPVS